MNATKTVSKGSCQKKFSRKIIAPFLIFFYNENAIIYDMRGLSHKKVMQSFDNKFYIKFKH
jgi:hypothetical protein